MDTDTYVYAGLGVQSLVNNLPVTNTAATRSDPTADPVPTGDTGGDDPGDNPGDNPGDGGSNNPNDGKDGDPNDGNAGGGNDGDDATCNFRNPAGICVGGIDTAIENGGRVTGPRNRW